MTVKRSVAVGLAVLQLAAGPAGDRGGAPADGGWGARADTAISRSIALDTGQGPPFHYAALADAISRRSPRGWRDPRARALLERILAARNPDGGWGLGYAWDAFQDGTVNPADTTYTVTLTGHVGPLLLAAHRAGLVPRDTVTALVRRVHRLPRVPSPTGRCVAYSASRHDVRDGYCVHNVNASVGLFLHQVRAAGWPVDERWIAQITRAEVAAYQPATHFWPYLSGARHLNDWPHNALSVEAMLVLAPHVGRAALDWMMAHADEAAESWYGHAALAPWDCAGARAWLDEFDRAMAKPAYRTFGMQVQAARVAARAAERCP